MVLARPQPGPCSLAPPLHGPSWAPQQRAHETSKVAGVQRPQAAAARVPPKPRRRGCTRCVSCSGLQRHAHSGSSGGSAESEEFAEWWPSGIQSPSVYYHLRRKQMAYLIQQQATRAALVWRPVAETAAGAPSALRASRGLPRLSVGIPLSCTNVAQNDTAVCYMGSIAVPLRKAEPLVQEQAAAAPQQQCQQAAATLDAAHVTSATRSGGAGSAQQQQHPLARTLSGLKRARTPGHFVLSAAQEPCSRLAPTQPAAAAPPPPPRPATPRVYALPPAPPSFTASSFSSHQPTPLSADCSMPSAPCTGTPPEGMQLDSAATTAALGPLARASLALSTASAPATATPGEGAACATAYSLWGHPTETGSAAAGVAPALGGGAAGCEAYPGAYRRRQYRIKCEHAFPASSVVVDVDLVAEEGRGEDAGPWGLVSNAIRPLRQLGSLAAGSLAGITRRLSPSP